MRLKLYLLIVTICTVCTSLISQDCEAHAGRITFSNMDTVYTTCAGDAVPDLLDVLVDSTVVADTSIFAVTDTAGVILLLSDSLPIDVEQLGSGTCFIYHLSFQDTLDSLVTGINLDSITGCFDFSNPLQVDKISAEVNGGIISTLSSTTICFGDDSRDTVIVSIEDNSGDQFAWLITDTLGNILDIPTSSSIIVDSFDAGNYLIWNISFGVGLSGLELGKNIEHLQGCYSFSNQISIQIIAPDGGTISALGQDLIYVCQTDSIAIDSINVLLEDFIGDSSMWLFTDSSGHIIGVPDGPPFDVSDLDSVGLHIWHLAFNDSISGNNIGDTINGLSGCFDLSNSLPVYFDETVDGGWISMPDSSELIELCDGQSTSLDILLQPGSGAITKWLLTDSSTFIVDIQDSLPVSLSGSSDVLIWNLSYNQDPPNLNIGQKVSEIQGCFGLSNFIQVVRQALEGGQITTRDTLTEVTFCPGDTTESSVDVQLDRGSGENGSWIISDSDGEILEIPLSAPFDFGNYDQGVYSIWYINYNDSLPNLVVGNDLDSLQGCFALSNSIRVHVGGVEGGRIFLPDSATMERVCIDDGLVELKFASLAGATGSQSQWIILNQDGYILEMPEAPPFSFEGFGSDTCYIQHVSYENEISGLSEGIHTTSLEGCFGLSNTIAIIKSQVEASTITTRDTATNAVVCAADELDDHVDVLLDRGSGENHAWAITDTAGIIVELPATPPFDFHDYGPGMSLIWHITYTGELERFDLGKKISKIRGCHALSEPIHVNHSGGAIGGQLTTRTGDGEIVICVESSFSDLVDVELNGASGDKMAWVITDNDGEIMQLPDQSPFVFPGDDPSDRFIWNISYQDGLSGLEVGEFLDDLVGCYDLSSSVRVIKKVNACGVEQLVEFGKVDSVGSDWKVVNLDNQYQSMVVVATPQLTNGSSKPVVTRVRNAVGRSFEIKVQNPSDIPVANQYVVRYIVAEEGVYQPEIDGIKMEARKMESIRTSKKRQSGLEPRDYVHLYRNPVVLGQVMTHNDDRWSVFWSSGARRKNFSPTPYSLSTSKHVGEEESSDRSDETLGVIIVEAGSYELNGLDWEVNTTPKAIRGVDDTNTGFQHETSLDSIYGGVLSSFGMRGSNYGWPVFFGDNPFEDKYITLAIDEDQVKDQERRHPSEEVAYILFGSDRSSLIDQNQVDVLAPPTEEQFRPSELSEGDMKISPNPATNYLQVEIESFHNVEAKLMILDVQGKKLLERDIVLQNDKNKFYLSDLSLTDGLYAITMVSSNGVRLQKKFIILR